MVVMVVVTERKKLIRVHNGLRGYGGEVAEKKGVSRGRLKYSSYWDA